MKQYICRSTGVILAVFLTVFCIFQIQRQGFAHNEEHADGNTPANLLNKGLFREYNDKIYFSNLMDDGRLYVMNSDLTGFKRLSNDRVNNINVSGKHIIYSCLANKKDSQKKAAPTAEKTGICITDLKGRDTTPISSNASGMVHQYGNAVYYQYEEDDKGVAFQKIDLTDKSTELILTTPISPASIIDDTLYYCGPDKDRSIYARNIKTGDTSLLLKGDFSHVAADEGYLYMIDCKHKNALFRSNLNGKLMERLVDKPVSAYNVTNDSQYLYYQVDDEKENGLYRMNLMTKENELVLRGNYSNINMTSQYVFFTDCKEEETYAVENIKDITIHTFRPPVEN